jgi:hypothetical protein
LIAVAAVPNPPPLVLLTTLHVINLSLILWLVWVRQWQWVGLGAGGARLAGDGSSGTTAIDSRNSGRR